MGFYITPLQAIQKECRYCHNSTQYNRANCNSELCKLSLLNDFKSNLKRIKSYCIACIPEQSLQGVRKCDGKILNPEPHLCPLRSFKLGKSLKRQGKGNPKALQIYRESKCHGGKKGSKIDFQGKRHATGHLWFKTASPDAI